MIESYFLFRINDSLKRDSKYTSYSVLFLISFKWNLFCYHLYFHAFYFSIKVFYWKNEHCLKQISTIICRSLWGKHIKKRSVASYRFSSEYSFNDKKCVLYHLLMFTPRVLKHPVYRVLTIYYLYYWAKTYCAISGNEVILWEHFRLFRARTQPIHT